MAQVALTGLRLTSPETNFWQMGRLLGLSTPEGGQVEVKLPDFLYSHRLRSIFSLEEVLASIFMQSFTHLEEDRPHLPQRCIKPPRLFVFPNTLPLSSLQIIRITLNHPNHPCFCFFGVTQLGSLGRFLVEPASHL